MGRPPKDPGDVRHISVTVRLSPTEVVELVQKAKLSGLPPATFLRQAALGTELPRPVPAINRTAWESLARLGGNLNQIAHQANAGAPISVNPAELANVARLVRLLRQDLLGDSPDDAP